MLKVGGVTPFTSIDFPGKLSAVVFVQGCPWRCLYCHNPHLQSREVPIAGAPAWPQVREWLGRRRGLLDGVVFSGGEPTIDAGLACAMQDVKAMGLLVGLHTAGMYPRRLSSVLREVDWAGFDIKAPLGDAQAQDHIVGVRDSLPQVAESLALLLAGAVPFECRTTAHPAWLAEPEIEAIASELAGLGVRHYALQIARPVEAAGAAGAALRHAPAAYPSPPLLATLNSLFETFTLRRP